MLGVCQPFLLVAPDSMLWLQFSSVLDTVQCTEGLVSHVPEIFESLE
jgi:hypothetical protein